MARWIRANRDKLVFGLGPKVQSLLDNLVVHGFFRVGDDDFQQIGAERTSNESARRLLDAVEKKGRRACEHLRQTVMSRGWCGDCTDSGENLSSGELSSSDSASDDSGTRRPRRRLRDNHAATRSRRRELRPSGPKLDRWSLVALVAIPVLLAALSVLLLANVYRKDAPADPCAPPTRNASQTDELVAEVHNFKKVLRTTIEDRARDNALPWLDMPPEPVGKLNVNLVLAQKTKSTSFASTVLGTGILGDTQTAPEIDVAKIFHSDPLDPMQTPVSRVLVTADAGMGKTFTFAKMMPMRWLREPDFWPQFDLVFVVLLGNPQASSAQTLAQFLFSDFGAEVNRETRKAVTRFVSRNPERVLVICDALDEGQHLLSPKVRGILNGTYHSGLHVLVTSRPCEAATNFSKRSHRHVELLGIRKEDLPGFFLKHLGQNEALGKELLLEVQQRPAMQSLVTSPLIASLVCSIFDQDRRLPASWTRLYELVVLNFIRRAGSKGYLRLSMEDFKAERLLQLSEEPRHALNLLSVLAACAEAQGKVFFTLEVTWNCFYQHDLRYATAGHHDGRTVGSYWQFLQMTYLSLAPKLGLLTRVIVYGHGLTIHASFVFVHKTFQEFLAAYFMQRHCHDFLRETPDHYGTPLPKLFASDINVDHRVYICLADTLLPHFRLPGNGGTDHNLVVWFLAVSIASPLSQDVISMQNREKECKVIVDSRSAMSILTLLQQTTELYAGTKGHRLWSWYRPVCGTYKWYLMLKLKWFLDQYPALQPFVDMNLFTGYHYWKRTLASMNGAFSFFITRLTLTKIFFNIRGKPLPYNLRFSCGFWFSCGSSSVISLIVHLVLRYT